MESNNTADAKVRALFEASIAVKQAIVREHIDVIVQMAEHCTAALRMGGKLLFCGNGGSAADAQHMAAELLVRLRPHVNRQAIPAIALTMDTSSLTACGNDYSFEAHYERMVEALGQPGDVLIGISTSSRSVNVIRAMKAARQRKVAVIGLLGCSGQPALEHCELALVVPAMETGRIQEAHITAGHAIMELIEDALLADARKSIDR